MTDQLERQLGDDLRGLVTSQPFEPDPAAVERRVRQDQRQRTVRTRAGVGAGLAAVVALSATAAVQPWASHPGTGRPAAGGRPKAAGPAPRPAGHPRTSAPAAAPVAAPAELTALARQLLAGGKPPGDATLVVRSQSYPDHPTVTVDDLYTDRGEYFFAHSRSGLPGQIASNNNQGDGVFAREVAAGTYAAHGDLATARHLMADAPLPSRTPAAARPGPDGRWPVTADDNYIWENSLDAFIAGSGQPDIRAGVLRILSTLPEVAVTRTTTAGQPTLTLRATGAAVAQGLEETMIIGATTGVPVKLTVAALGRAPDATVTYQISRVTLSQLVSGGR